jgi:pilus assembly protein CpaB
MMLRLLILTAAIAAGGFAGWLALNLQSDEASAAVVVQLEPQAPGIDVLVASAEVAQGRGLDITNLRWQSWPEEALHPDFITRSARPDAIEAISGGVARSRIVAGEPVLDDKVAQNTAGFLAGLLPAGKRAVAIVISAEHAAGGFILPNDRVDVIVARTQQTHDGGSAETLSRTILRNIRVLAVDQIADETGDQASVLGRTATLELDPAEAEVAASAQASGTVFLALRSAADAAEAPQAAVAAPRTVRVVRGVTAEIVRIP